MSVLSISSDLQALPNQGTKLGVGPQNFSSKGRQNFYRVIGTYSGPPASQTSQARGAASRNRPWQGYTQKSKRLYSHNGSRSGAQKLSDNFAIFVQLYNLGASPVPVEVTQTKYFGAFQGTARLTLRLVAPTVFEILALKLSPLNRIKFCLENRLSPEIRGGRNIFIIYTESFEARATECYYYRLPLAIFWKC